MAKRWRILPHDAGSIAALQRSASLPAVVAQLLVGRGICDPAVARQFLDPKLSALRDPSLLPGCAEATQRIGAAVAAGRRIVVYGDYDVDGITGTALLRQCLKLLGGDVGYYVPHRLDEGYGLNREALRTLAAEKAELVITVDCGITSLAPAATARGMRHRADRHRSSRAGRTAAGGVGHRPSPFARLGLSLPQPERLRGGLQIGLVALPTRQRS